MEYGPLIDKSAHLAHLIGRLGVFAMIALLMPEASTAHGQARFDIGQLPTSQLPYDERVVLTANTANVFRLLVPADRSAGVNQIKMLSGKTSFEEQWVFVPAINLWIEIGRNESVSELDSMVETDMEYLKEIARLFEVVQIFHFHPADFYIRAWGDTLLAGSSSGAIAEAPHPIGFALPSPTDIVASLQISEAILTEFPQASITHSVVSPHGIMTYGATALGLEKIGYEQGNPRGTLFRSLVSRISIRRMEFNIARTIAALGNPSIGEVIDALAMQCSDEHYALSFTPF